VQWLKITLRLDEFLMNIHKFFGLTPENREVIFTVIGVFILCFKFHLCQLNHSYGLEVHRFLNLTKVSNYSDEN